jgi:protein-S-isoprenylcysteine O-methyltransferase Ste14
MDLINTLLSIEYVFAAISFLILLFVSAPYGRFVRSGWGPTLPAKWAWMIMEFPAMIVIFLIFLKNGSWTNPISVAFIILWEIHYVQRTLIYPLTLKSGKKAFPVLLVLFAILFNSLNGFLNGTYLFEIQIYSLSWFQDPRFIIGLIIFAIGFLINRQSDKILSSLRNNGKGYQIPQKGVFKYVSSPHYLGEIIEWTGWAILTWSPAGLAFAVFTFANLAPRAISHHKWYKDEFEDYPKNRKILIPFIW